MNSEKLHKKGLIDKNKPFWWDLDYSSDPRELVSPEDFLKNTIELGYHWHPLMTNSKGLPVKVKFSLYMAEKVPITLINTDLKERQLNLFEPDSENITLFATARPYNKRELETSYNLDKYWPVENLVKLLEDCDADTDDMFAGRHSDFNREWVMLYAHFFPHIRGIFKERVGNHFFWHQLLGTDSTPAIRESMGELSNKFSIYPSVQTWYEKVGAQSISSESPRHPTPFGELKNKRLINATKAVKYPTGDLEEVAYDEFVSRKDGSGMISVYPVRLPGIDETITVVFSTRAMDKGRKGCYVLGVMGNYSHRENYNIWRLRDEGLSHSISKTLKDELDSPFEVFFFKQGRYKTAKY